MPSHIIHFFGPSLLSSSFSFLLLLSKGAPGLKSPFARERKEKEEKKECKWECGASVFLSSRQFSPGGNLAKCRRRRRPPIAKKERKKFPVCEISPPPSFHYFFPYFFRIWGGKKGLGVGEEKRKGLPDPSLSSSPTLPQSAWLAEAKKWNTSRFLSGSTQDRKSPIWVLQKGTKKRKNNPFWRIRERRPPLNTHSHFAVLLKGGEERGEETKTRPGGGGGLFAGWWRGERRRGTFDSSFPEKEERRFVHNVMLWRKRRRGRWRRKSTFLSPFPREGGEEYIRLAKTYREEGEESAKNRLLSRITFIRRRKCLQ